MGQPGLNLLIVCNLSEPIRLIEGIPGTLGKAVTPLFFTETSQYFRRLGRDSALTGSLNKCFFELVGAHAEQNFWRPIICDAHSLHSLGDLVVDSTCPVTAVNRPSAATVRFDCFSNAVAG